MKYNAPIDLSGKVAVVTGARQGLGKIFAEALAGAGAEVFLMARNTAELEKATAEIAEKTGAKCHWYPIDILEEASVEAAAEHVKQKAGGCGGSQLCNLFLRTGTPGIGTGGHPDQ